MDVRPDSPDGDGMPPWDEEGCHRLDLEPHRAEFLAWLAFWSYWLGVVSLCLCLPFLVAVPLGSIVCVLGWRDLAEMRARRMDPTGEEQTRAAIHIAVAGIVMSLIAILIGSMLAGVVQRL